MAIDVDEPFLNVVGVHHVVSGPSGQRLDTARPRSAERGWNARMP